MSATRQQIVECARSYVGVRFKHEGRTREEGLDCIGLLLCITRDFQLSSFTISGYGRVPHPPTVRAICRKHMTRKPPATMKIGDVVLCAYKHWESHFAIIGKYKDRFTLIHSYFDAHRVVEETLNEEWRSHIRACYQLPNVQEVPA